MGGVVTREHELRVLEVDQEDLIRKIKSLGGRKFFDGELETRLYQLQIINASERIIKKPRLRHYKGHLYLTTGGIDSQIIQVLDYTEVAVKDKIPDEETNSSVSSSEPNPRSYEERVTERCEGNQLRFLERQQINLGAQRIAWDLRHRTSYIQDLIRFELDTFTATERLGERRLPLMLEVETPHKELTKQMVLALGYTFEEEVAPGVPRVCGIKWKLGQIFDYYARQSPDAE